MYYLLIDAGGTFIKYALCDDDLQFKSKGSVPSPGRCPAEVYYQTILDIFHGFDEEIKGIGISMAGLIDYETGLCPGSALLEETNLNIADDLTRLTGLPVAVLNDGHAAGFAELGYGNLTDVRNGLIMVLGTGIGGSLVLDHKFYAGSHKTAGNLSFLLTDINHTAPGKTFAYYNGIRGLMAAIEETSGLSGIDGLKAFQLIREGNKEVENGLIKFCDHLAFQIFNIQHLLDLDRVLIGGGISREPLLIDYIRDSYEKLASVQRVRPHDPEIMACRYSNDANLLGALYNWKQHFER